MVITRSQALRSTVKKEDTEDKSKLHKLLQGIGNASMNNSKVTKNKGKATRSKTIVLIINRILIAKAKTKIENASKAASTSAMITFTRSKITKEQIANVIDYMANDKMSARSAAKKANMSLATAQKYYCEYQDDPEHKIPLPKTRLSSQSTRVTQQKLEDLIYCIEQEKMTVAQAAWRVKIDRGTAYKYYTKYKNDPKHRIPTLFTYNKGPPKRYTQEQVNDLIDCITKDNMSVVEAAEKINMGKSTALKYYERYLNDPNNNIPIVQNYKSTGSRKCTGEQIEKVISYILNDGMILREASAKAGISETAASRHFKSYLKNLTHKTSTLAVNHTPGPGQRVSLDQAKCFFHHIIIDKLTIAQASRKANIAHKTGTRYYNQYLKNPNKKNKITNRFYTVKKMKAMVELVQKDNMAISSAAKKVNLNNKSAFKFYRQYLEDPQHQFHELQCKKYSYKDIKKLIGFIVRDKMTVCAAAGKAGMSKTAAWNYYRMYKEDPEHNIPSPMVKRKKQQHMVFDKYSQAVADIYKNIPSVYSTRKRK